MTARPSVFFRTPQTCIPATILRRTDGAGRWCRRRCGGRRATMHVGAPFMTPGAGTARPVRGIALGGVRGGAGKLRYCDGHPGDTSVAPTLRGVRSRNRGRPWLSTVDDFDDGDGLDKLTFRYVTVRSNLDGAFSIRYVDVLTVIIRGRFIGQQKYNCPDRRHDHS